MSGDTNGTRDLEQQEDRVSVLKPDEDLLRRLKVLEGHFVAKYGVRPSFFVRVPGRVNLIGEHIDYCGYAVCPMAIEQDIIVATSTSQDNEIRLTDVESKYKDFRCSFDSVDDRISEPESGPAWYKYFLCGVKGALEAIPTGRAPTGILAAVWGNIPPNAGLSSSSALVSAALLSIVHASQYTDKLSKRELATISAQAERHIGTQGGGMDQAIAFLGNAGTAKFIEFNPLKASDVTLPEDAVFVIAHSRVYHNKASTNDYNLRVAECRFGAQIIAKKRGKDWSTVRRLIDIQQRLNVDLEEMASIVMADLHEEPYTLEEICETLGATYEKLRESTRLATYDATQPFKLRQRALHVFQEAARVVAFRRCNEENDSTPAEDCIYRLGRLMNKSHSSLRNLYECSHPRVDELVERTKACGALGSRLTGAGWGGCIVAIVKKNAVDAFVEILRQDLTGVELQDGLEPKDLVFPTASQQGAAIYAL